MDNFSPHSIGADEIKNLVALTHDGKIDKLPIVVLRKLKKRNDQRMLLKKQKTICIVCNYAFLEKPVEWVPFVRAICHPFKHPEKVFPSNVDQYLFSESDFCDPLWIKADCGDRPRKWDFLWITLDEVQGITCKGLYLLPFVDRAARELGMKGLIIDYSIKHRPPTHKKRGTPGHDLISIRKNMKNLTNIDIRRRHYSQDKLCSYMNKCKFVFFPNTRDASPRILTEALIRGRPVLVNSNIYGGWKYVNEINGLFFNGGTSLTEIREKEDKYLNHIKEGLQSMRDKKFDKEAISNDFLSKYGFANACTQLARICNRILNTEKYKYVCYEEMLTQLKLIRNK